MFINRARSRTATVVVLAIIGTAWDRADGARIIAHWPFDVDGSDVAGNHDASLFGDALISADGDAPAGQALVLDGDGDYAMTNEYSPDFELQTGTISLWYQGAPPAEQNRFYDLLDLHHGIVHGPHHSWVVQGSTESPDDRIGWFFAQGGGVSTDGNPLLDGKWHHLVANFAAGSSDPTWLYIDGEPVAQGGQPPIITYFEIEPLVFGRWGAAVDEGFPPNDRDFNGRIDDVQIYDFPLDESQVEFLFDNPGEEIVVDSCPEDLDGSGAVDFGDIVLILSHWGESDRPEDIDGSGIVDFGDLVIVLAAWGPCDYTRNGVQLLCNPSGANSLRD